MNTIPKNEKAAGASQTANHNTHANNALKLYKKQARKGGGYEVMIPSGDGTPPRVLIISGKAAKSLFLLYHSPYGLPRAEVLARYGVLCLTQHVGTMRHDWGLDIYTERVKPQGHARYHLITRLSIRALQGGQ